MIHHLTYTMLDRKFPKTNTIAMSQHYMIKLLENPNTSAADRRVAVSYIRDHPQIFTARPENTGNPISDEAARKINGNRAVQSFLDVVDLTFGRGF